MPLVGLGHAIHSYNINIVNFIMFLTDFANYQLNSLVCKLNVMARMHHITSIFKHFLGEDTISSLMFILLGFALLS